MSELATLCIFDCLAKVLESDIARNTGEGQVTELTAPALLQV